jgi:hypothetical protein
MGRAQRLVAGVGVGVARRQQQPPKFLSFTRERFVRLIACDLGESCGSEAVAEHIENISDDSAIPWHVMPEIERYHRRRLRASAEDGDDVVYQLVELELESLEESAEAGYCWVDQGVVDEYVRRYNPPAVVFIEEGDRVLLLDGSHRLQAALTRKDRKILAWVPRSLLTKYR